MRSSRRDFGKLALAGVPAAAKDKKKAANGGGNGPWGTGDTPIKAVLKLVQKNKWKFPNNIEFEYEGDPVTEVAKCFQLCKEMLA